MGRITRAYPEELLEGLDMDVREERYLYMEPLAGGSDKVSDASGALQTFDQGNDVLSVSLSKAINSSK